jgi:hypothetical protein
MPHSRSTVVLIVSAEWLLLVPLLPLLVHGALVWLQARLPARGPLPLAPARPGARLATSAPVSHRRWAPGGPRGMLAWCARGLSRHRRTAQHRKGNPWGRGAKKRGCARSPPWLHGWRRHFAQAPGNTVGECGCARIECGWCGCGVCSGEVRLESPWGRRSPNNTTNACADAPLAQGRC